MEMPRLLRDILCVIETFHKYAREDGDMAALTPGELKQLLQVEFGDVLQPRVFHAVERKLNLLDIDRNGSISFEEFVLTIFSLLKPCHLDIQSLTSEPGQASSTEKTSPADPGAPTRNGQPMAKTLPDQGIASSTQLSHEAGEAGGHDRVSPWGDARTHDLPGEAPEPRGAQNQHVEEDEQEVEQEAQDAPVTEDDGAPCKTSKDLEGPNQTSSLTEETPPEEDKPLRRRRSTNRSDRFEEETLEPQEGAAQRPPEGQEVATETGIKKCSKPQVPSLPGEDEAGSGHTDLPGQAAAGKPSQTQKLVESVDGHTAAETQEPGKDADGTAAGPTNPDEPEVDRRTPESRELSAQEGEEEPSDQSAQSSSGNVPEAQREEERIPEAQKKHERKTRPPAPEAPTQDGQYQNLQGPSRERDTEGDSKAQDLSSEEGGQNHPEIEGQETRRAERGSQTSPPAEAAPGVRGRRHDLAPLGSQSQGENVRDPRPHDKPLAKEDGCEGKDLGAPATQNESSSETPNSLAPETLELRVPEDSESRVDPRGGSVQGDHRDSPGAQSQGVPAEASRAQKVEVLSTQEESHFPGEQEPPAGEHDRPGLGSRGGPGAATEPDGHSETQESAEGDDHRKPPWAERSSGRDAGCPEHASGMKLPGKGGRGPEPHVQDSDPKDEGGAPETQATILKNLGEDKPASPTAYHGKRGPATLEGDDESPQGPSEGDDQRSDD